MLREDYGKECTSCSMQRNTEMTSFMNADKEEKGADREQPQIQRSG